MIPGNSSKLAPWHRRVIAWALIALATTGVVWMAGHYALEFLPDLDGPDARSALHIVIMSHGVIAYGAAIAVGSLLGRHIPAGLKTGRKLKTGITALVLLGVLTITALLLYYASHEGTRAVASLAHQTVGVVGMAILAAHVAHKAPMKD